MVWADSLGLWSESGEGPNTNHTAMIAVIIPAIVKNRCESFFNA